MENSLFAILSLIWVIYLFLFTEADRKISELLDRLKSSLAINEKGIFELSQYEAKKALRVPEIIDFGKELKKVHPKHTYSKNIDEFYKKYQEINQGKIFLICNLFILSCNIIALSFLGISNC